MTALLRFPHGLMRRYLSLLERLLVSAGLAERIPYRGVRVVELTPHEQLAYTNLSRIYQRAGDVPKAEEWAARGRVLDWKQQLKD